MYCFSDLNKADELKDYLDTMYAVAAQYNHPPRYPVTVVCGGIDGAPEGSDILSRIFEGLVAFRGNESCYNTSLSPTETSEGWRWQVNTYFSMITIILSTIKYFVGKTESLCFRLDETELEIRTNT